MTALENRPDTVDVDSGELRAASAELRRDDGAEGWAPLEGSS